MPSLVAVAILGSHRRESNTEILLDYLLNRLESCGVSVEKIRLRELDIKPCYECRKCLELGECCVRDDMTERVIPSLLKAHIVIVATPVYFNNVSSLTKIFMDRTWCLRGKLRNKILGYVVVGRGYGLDTARLAIIEWGLKHEMIVGDRGAIGTGFEYGEVKNDTRAFRDADKHARRLVELAKLIHNRSLQ